MRLQTIEGQKPIFGKRSGIHMQRIKARALIKRAPDPLKKPPYAGKVALKSALMNSSKMCVLCSPGFDQ